MGLEPATLCSLGEGSTNWATRAAQQAGLKSQRKQVNKPICKLAQAYVPKPRLLTLRHKKPQRRVYIDSRMLSTTTVASPCQTLRELLAGDHEYINSPAHQLAVPRMRSSPRVCTFVLFHCLRVCDGGQRRCSNSRRGGENLAEATGYRETRWSGGTYTVGNLGKITWKRETFETSKNA